MLTLDTSIEPGVDGLEPQAVLREARSRQKRRRRRVAGVVLLTVVIVALLVLVNFGGDGSQGAPSGRHPSRPGSSRVNPLVPGVPRSLPTGQYLLTQATGTIAVHGLSGMVTIPALARQWTSQGTTCLQVAFGAPEFTSAAQRSAWLATGLSLAPLKTQPEGFCEENIPGGGALAQVDGSPTHWSVMLPLGLGLIDVSALPTDPATLAADLQDGRIDHGAGNLGVAPGSVNDPGFERASLLLRTPKIGETTALQSALLRALPLLPGVDRLGPRRTARGETGVGFATGRSPGSPTVILDPRTGQLLEARNFAAGTLYGSVGMMSFWNPYAQSATGTDAGAVTQTMVAFDPSGHPQVVDTLPAFGFPA